MRQKYLRTTRARARRMRAHHGFVGLLAGAVVASTLVGGLIAWPLATSASASGGVVLYASPSGSGTCLSSSSACLLSDALSVAGGDSGAVVTINLVHSSGAQCSTTGTCIFGADQTVSGDEKSLTIEGSGTGSGSSAATVLDGSDGGIAFTDNATFPVTLDNVTVTAGNAGDTNGGGGIYNYYGTMTVTDSTISGNTAPDGGYGGGIYNDYGTMTVTDSTISGNYAATGGGIINYQGTMTVTDSTISGNHATYGSSATFGGGVDNYGTMTIAGSIISGNTVGSSDNGGGGGIVNFTTLTVTDSTISGNTADLGGGVDNNGTMTVADSTISGNTASAGGGGGVMNFTTMTVADSTISENTANDGGYGGGVENDGTVAAADSTISGNTAAAGAGGILNFATMTVAGSIVADQTEGGNCYDAEDATLTDAGYNLSNGTSCGFTAHTSHDSATLDLGALAANGGPTDTIALLGTSSSDQALGAITSPATASLPTKSGSANSTVELCSDTSYTTATGYIANLSVDQRGVSRTTTGCDAGAYQIPYTSPPPPPPPYPVITSMSPTEGSTTGGTTVTITGTNFASGATVDFGTTPATDVVVVSSTSITAVSPASQPGTVDVTVAVNGLTSGTTSSGQFTYEAAYMPISPTRICDTRPDNPSKLSGAAAQCNGKTLSPNAPLDVSVAGLAGVPSTGVSAVVLNVTAANEETSGYLTVYPAGESQPPTSNLSFTAGDIVTNLVEVGVGSSDQVAIVSNTSTDVVVDVEGYYSVSSTAGAGLYNGLPPARICDTRPGNPSKLFGAAAQCNGRTLSPNTPLSVQVTGNGGVPSFGVSAVVVDLTADNYSSGGYMAAYAAGVTAPTTSNVNFASSDGAVSNEAIVPVGSSGEIDLVSDVTTDAIVDVSGYFTAASSGGTGSQFNSEAAPVRIVDTRCSTSVPPSSCSEEAIPSANSGLGTLGAGQSITVQVTGVAGVPSGATAVAVNVTTTGTTANGFLSVNPVSTPPNTSNMNWLVGETVANLVIAKISSSGSITIYNYAGAANVVVDVMGWYSAVAS